MIFSSLLAVTLLLSFISSGVFAAVASTFKNSNSFGTYLTFALFVGIARITLGTGIKTYIEWIVFLLVFFAFVGAMSRSSYVGFTVGLIYTFTPWLVVGRFSSGLKLGVRLVAPLLLLSIMFEFVLIEYDIGPVVIRWRHCSTQ